MNWAYHAFNKPSEVLFPLDHSLNKRPIETWKEYGPLFREHATSVITAELLAALAQTEGQGIRWHGPTGAGISRGIPWNGTNRPRARSACIRSPTEPFAEATRYCIHDHVVAEDGPWNDLNSCWFNSLYTRVVPSHAIEVTSALLDRAVAKAIGTRWGGKVTLRQKQDLAALIHLCGAGAGHAYASRGFRLTPHQQCGDHDVSAYLARVNALKFEFAKPAAGDKTIRQTR